MKQLSLLIIWKYASSRRNSPKQQFIVKIVDYKNQRLLKFQ